MTSAPIPIRVRFADTDAMGVAYYGTYLAWLETARVETMRAVGLLYGDLTARGLHSPVVEANVRYKQPAHLDDLLEIDAWIAEVGKAQFSFDYELKRPSDDTLIATAHTKHACVDAQTMRPTRLPDWLATALEGLTRHGR